MTNINQRSTSMEHATTDLDDNTIGRRSRVQRVRYVDVYPVSDLPGAPIHTTVPRIGTTTEGHGRGIRVLFDFDLSGKDARALVEILASREASAVPEPESISDEDLLSRLTDPDPVVAQEAFLVIRQRAGVGSFDDDIPL